MCEGLFTKKDSNPSQQNWNQNPPYATIEGFINCGASIQRNIAELNITNDVGEYLSVLIIVKHKRLQNDMCCMVQFKNSYTSI